MGIDMKDRTGTESITTWLDEKYRVKLFVLESDQKYDMSLFNMLYKMGYSFQTSSNPDTLNLQNLLLMMPRPLLIILEPCYVDWLYRDSYYHYYSEVLANISRNCSRLSFFSLNQELYTMISNHQYTNDEEILFDSAIIEKLEDGFIGTVTLRPLYKRNIGRVLLDPGKLFKNKMYLRKTRTTVTIYGHRYPLEFFPLAGQDGLYMTCAETSIWMLFEYFGLQYSDYHTFLPSEFISYNEKNDPERTLPTQGMVAITKSRILKNFGLYPKIYALDIFKKRFTYGKDVFYTLFHVYVESGIPLVLSLLDDQGNNGHSVLCIGHGVVNYNILDDGDKEYIYWENKEYGVKIVDSSCLVDKYVIMDDNSVPYKCRPLEKLSFHNNKLKYFIAPLNRKVYMDALHAIDIFNVLIYRYIESISEYLKDKHLHNEKVIKRVYLTTSRKYKAFRAKHGVAFLERDFYANLPCAKFVWIMELGTQSNYKEGFVFAEFMLDATGGNEFENSTILVRIGNKVGYRAFDESPTGNIGVIDHNKLAETMDHYCDIYGKAEDINDQSIDFDQIASCLTIQSLRDLDKVKKEKIQNKILDGLKELLSVKNQSSPEQFQFTKSSIKQIIEDSILSLLYDDSIDNDSFMNSPEFIINDRFTKSENTRIFSNEFKLYQNNLFYV